MVPATFCHEPDQRPDHARRDIRWGHLWRRELGHSHLHAGTPSSVATTFDGWPLCQKGRADLGLYTSLLSSAFGGIVGTLFLLCLGGSLARFALQFGGPESFGCVSSGSPPSR